MHVVTKWLRLESRGFRYKVALYLSYMYLRANFDYEIKENQNIHVILYLPCFNCIAINKKLAGLSKVTEK